MQLILNGGRCLSFYSSYGVHTSTMLTAQVNTDNDEATFAQRLPSKCMGQVGTFDILFEAGSPSNAVILIGR